MTDALAQAHAALPQEPAEPLMAASISVTACGCGSIYVRFHDETGVIFAAAAMPLPVAAGFQGQMMDEIEGVMAGLKAGGCVH